MRQNSFRFVCLLFGLSFLGGEMKAQQKSAHETGLRSKSTSELAELEQVITKVNYDESKVPVYTLPDVLTLTNGRKVTTKKEWVEKRRPELLRLFETQIYGKAPVRSKDLHFRLLNEDREALGGLATRKEVAVYLTKDEKHYLTVLMYLPNRRKGTVPMFFGINFKGNHAIHPDETVEIRLTLNRSGNYEEAGYQIGYIQMEGSGEVYDKKKVYLVNREMQPLDSIAELDDSDPCRQVFTLFYHNRSSKNAEIKFVIADNFHQERELDISFQSETETDMEL